jgi:protein farnesyltransferase subunit beta
MRDKPGKSRDFYHTCYSLSGLAVAQSFQIPMRKDVTAYVLGDMNNLLLSTSAVYNIGLDKLDKVITHFYAGNVPCTHLSLISE